MRKLKILIATEGYRTDTNGVAYVATLHADMLRRYGHEAKVLSLAIGKKSYNDLLENMRRESGKKAEDFSSNKFADKMIRIYERLLADKEKSYEWK